MPALNPLDWCPLGSGASGTLERNLTTEFTDDLLGPPTIWFVLSILRAAGTLAPFGFVMLLAVGAVLMPVSIIIVAIHAQVRRGTNRENRYISSGYGEKHMKWTAFALLVLVLFIFTACGAPPVVQQDAQPAVETQAVAAGIGALPVVTVYKPPT